MKAITLVIICFASFGWASGNRVGNGGHLVDFYELSQPLKSFDSAKNYQDILKELLKNLERISPSQAKQYGRRVAEFQDEVEFKKEVSLVDIKDSRYLFTAKDKDCKLLQIAIRRNESSSVTKRFIIDQELWDRLSERSKAGLVMHEVIYEHFYKLGEIDSVKARAVNGYLFTEKAFSDAPTVYWRIIQDLKLPVYK
jgi:hypothetical protein